jgi:hypothetical protein
MFGADFRMTLSGVQVVFGNVGRVIFDWDRVNPSITEAFLIFPGEIQNHSTDGKTIVRNQKFHQIW